MATQFELDDFSVKVVRKRMKNVHLRVYPPTAEVRISAPVWVSLTSIRDFALSKLAWIQRQRKKILDIERQGSFVFDGVVDDAGCREQIKAAAPELFAKWEPVLGVKVEKFSVRRMKTLWGSCNTRKRSIRLNSRLATKPKECLEYIVVHEMVHLLERSHNARFKNLMTSYMPNWKTYRKMLNGRLSSPQSV